MNASKSELQMKTPLDESMLACHIAQILAFYIIDLWL